MEEKIKKKIGRPSKGEIAKAKLRQKSFYYPIRIENIFKEFDRLVIQKTKIGKVFPERAKSSMIRKLILYWTLKNTQKQDIKEQIERYLKEEQERIDKIIDNVRGRNINNN